MVLTISRPALNTAAVGVRSTYRTRPSFIFNAAATADTFQNPNTAIYGDQYASFLLGALDPTTEVVGGGVPNPITNFYGIFFQDDWKVNKRLTLNLGLRDEYESAWHDSAHLLSQAMNLSAPGAGDAGESTPDAGSGPGSGGWQQFLPVDRQLGIHERQPLRHVELRLSWRLAPRAGLAFRIDDKTALRAGYARYVIPTEYNFTAAPISGFEDINFLEPPFFGMTGYQFVAPLASGVPQATLSNPFNSTNPLLPNFGPLAGKALGTNIGRGGENLLWYPQNLTEGLQRPYQRQLPAAVAVRIRRLVHLLPQSRPPALH